MGAIFGVLLAVLAVAFGVALLFLLLPLRLELQLVREEDTRFTAALRPFGRLGPRILLSGLRKSPKPKKKPRRRKARSVSQTPRNPMRIAEAAVHFVAEFVHVVRLETAKVEFRFGLGDPAETGQVFGQMTPLIYGTHGCTRIRLSVEPVFHQAMLRGRAELDLSLVPVRLVAPIVRFGWCAFGPAR